MAIQNINPDILVHESQLGEQLGQSVHQKRRSDFSLMLAMLTDDVLAHSQFQLPKAQAEAKPTTNEQLRKLFQLPKQISLALESLDEIASFNQAALTDDAALTALRLMNSLNPKALAFRDQVKHVPSQVLANTSLYCQQKYQHQDARVEADEFNAKAWLTAVHDCRVKAPIMEAVA